MDTGHNDSEQFPHFISVLLDYMSNINLSVGTSPYS